MALALTEEILDFPRHAATHVGGFVITRGPLIELAVVTNAAMEDRTVLEWDKDDIDALGILKVDVLGLGMLSCLRRAFDLLAGTTGSSTTWPACRATDPATYAMLRRADSLGVFQVESRAQMNMLPRLRPERFYDLVIEVAIVRPGPIQGDMVHPYLRRKWKRGAGHLPLPCARAWPAGRAGAGAGQDPRRAAVPGAGDAAGDRRRRLHPGGGRPAAPGHGDLQAVGRRHPPPGAAGRGHGPAAAMSAAFAERVFQQIEGFGGYGFPESHAASFAHLVYASAWVKCHHPAVFACALLNSQPMGFYAPAQIVRDAREHGVAILAVDVNASDWDSTLEPQAASTGGLALRLGLRLVAGLPEAEARAILAARRARNGAPFASVEEAALRAGVGRQALEALAGADAFAGTGASRRRAGWEARGVANGPQDLPLFAVAAGTEAAAMAAQAPLVPEPAVTLPDQTEGEAVVEDYLATGMTLRRHPLALLRPQLEALGCGDTRQLNARRAGTKIRLPGLVLIRQRPGSAKGVVFLTVEDEHGVANLVVFERIAARDRAALVSGRLLIAEGRVEREVAQAEVPITHLIVERLIDRSDLLSRLVEIEDGDTPGPGLDGEGARPGRRGAAPRARQPTAQAAGQPGFPLRQEHWETPGKADVDRLVAGRRYGPTSGGVPTGSVVLPGILSPDILIVLRSEQVQAERVMARNRAARTGRLCYDDAARSNLLCVTKTRNGSAGGGLRLHAIALPGFFEA